MKHALKTFTIVLVAAFQLGAISIFAQEEGTQPVINDIIQYTKLSDAEMVLDYSVDNVLSIDSTFVYLEDVIIDTLLNSESLVLSGLTEGDEYFYALQVDSGGIRSPIQNAYFIHDDNMIINPQFNAGVVSDSNSAEYGYHRSWIADGAGSYTIVQDANLSGTNAAYVTVDDAGGSYWKVQFKALPQGLEEGGVYALSFMAKAEPDTFKNLSVELFGRTDDGKESLWVGNDVNTVYIDDTTIYYGPMYVFEREGKFGNQFNLYELSFNGGNDNVDFWIDSITMVAAVDTVQPVISDLVGYQKLPGGNIALSYTVDDNVGYTTTYLFKDGEPVDTFGNSGGIVINGMVEGAEYFYELQVRDAGGNLSPKQNAYFIYDDNLVVNSQMNAGAVSDSVETEYGYNKGWFADGAGTWSVDNSNILSGANSMFIDIDDAGGTYWRAQFKAIPQNLKSGNVYALSFMARAPEDTSKVISTEVFGRGPDGKEGIWTGPEDNQVLVDDESIYYGPYFIYEKDGAFKSEFSRFELSFNCGHDNVDIWIDSINVVEYQDTVSPEFGIITLKEIPIGLTVTWDVSDDVGILYHIISVNNTPVDTITGNTNTYLFQDLSETDESILSIKAVDPVGHEGVLSTSYIPGNMVQNPKFNAGAGGYTEYMPAGSWEVVDDGIDGKSAKITITDEEPSWWDGQFKALPFGFESGKLYVLNFQARPVTSGEVKNISIELFGRATDGKVNLFVGNEVESNMVEISDASLDYGPIYIWEREGDFSEDYLRYELSFNNANDVVDVLYDNIELKEYTGENEAPVLQSVKKASVSVFTLEFEATDDLGIKEYQISKNGIAYDTATNFMWKDEVDPVKDDVYAVVAVDIMGVKSQEISYTWGTVGIDEANLPNVKIHPNPAEQVLFISNAAAFDKMVVYNETGTSVLNATIHNQDVVELSLTDLEEGVYFVKLKGKYGTRVAAFVKK
jgi:hypothetical protein